MQKLCPIDNIHNKRLMQNLKRYVLKFLLICFFYGLAQIIRTLLYGTPHVTTSTIIPLTQNFVTFIVSVVYEFIYGSHNDIPVTQTVTSSGKAISS